MTNKKDDISEEERKLKEGTAKVYQERLKILKKAQEYSQADEIPKAVDLYGRYLNALALYYKVDEKLLDPKLFDPEKDLAELFLISHVYWDLAKAYDRSPNLHLESIRCLDQYVKFTIGFKYQYVNARTIKTFIRKRLAHNPKAFKQAHERIQVESKGCFVSSDLYGKDSQVTNDLRVFKSKSMKYKSFQVLFSWYYNLLCPSYFYIAQIPVINFFNRALFKIIVTSTWLMTKNLNDADT